MIELNRGCIEMIQDFLSTISEAHAALIAAVLSGLAVLISLVITVAASRSDARRAAYRQALTPYLETLGASLHQVAACTRVMAKRYRQGQDAAQWEGRAEEAKKNLESVRLATVYILPGFRDPLRSAALLPDKVATFKRLSTEAQDKMLLASGALVDRINKEILRAFRSGRVPSSISRWRVKRAEAKVKGLWNRRRDLGSGT